MRTSPVRLLAVIVVLAGVVLLALPAASAQAANGCGPAGTTKVDLPEVYGPLGVRVDLPPIFIKTANLVPDSAGPIFDFKSACSTHDKCYARWKARKKTCDKQFRSNMLRKCSNQTCRNLALDYYTAVALGGKKAHQGAQIGTGLKRKLKMKLLTKPRKVTTSPFARFIWRISNGYTPALGTSCTLDGKPQLCGPTPLFTVDKGKHKAKFTAANNKSRVSRSYSWTVK